MRIRRSITAAAAVVVLSGTGALVLPAVASAHSASTTPKSTAVTNKSIRLTNKTLVQAPASALVQAPASAAQHQGGAVHVFWTMPGASGNLWNIDQIMWIEKKAKYTYWAMQFPLSGTPDNNGYMGLQTNATRPNGTVGDMAIFSLWNADKARNGNCSAFDGEGNGLSCRVGFSITTNVEYRYRVFRLDADATGQWWGAWILNTATGKDIHLGDLHVTATTLGTPINFTEYWGAAVSCDKVPKSIVDWTQPAGNYSGSASTGYQYYSSYAGFDALACISASGSPKDYGWTQGVRIIAGSA